jgi:hypothetical protein
MLGGLAAAALSACSKARQGGGSPSARPSSNALASSGDSAAGSLPAPGVSAAPPKDARPVPKLDETAVRTLVDDWLSAQNRGDFEAYQRLYAERFTGIKRSGTYQATFARASWLKDRAGMFTHAMRVSVKDLELAVIPSGAQVQMVQTWSTANYTDVGAKQLVIVPTADGPRIAREEMLSSVVGGANARAGSKDLLPMHEDGLVLSRNPEDSWVAGPMPEVGAHYVVRRAVKEAGLPAELRAWKGKAVRIIDHSGAQCETKVVGFIVRAQVYPHFGMEAQWSGRDGEGRDGGRVFSGLEIANEIWKLSENGGRVLIGKVEAACGGLWALDATKAPPPVAAPTPATPELKEAALRAFRALPRYKEIQSEYLKMVPGAQGQWADFDGQHADVVAFRFADRITLVHVGARVGHGCGDFSGDIGALFGVRKGTTGVLELLDTLSADSPRSAFDLNGDGSYEVLFGTGGDGALSLWHKSGKGSALDDLFSVPNFDCGC